MLYIEAIFAIVFACLKSHCENNSNKPNTYFSWIVTEANTLTNRAILKQQEIDNETSIKI